jgi:hypothetical protein
MKKIVVLLLIFTSGFSHLNLNAQFILEGQLDLGNNNLSRGLYLQFSNIGYYEKQFWGVQSGYQIGLIQPQDVFFNSWYANAYGKIPLGKIRLILGGEYLWANFSPDFREINWIITAGTSLKHWKFALGNNTRIYRLSRKTAKTDLIADPESRIMEGGNLMYSISFAIKPFENKWNLIFTLTDYDRFIVQQEMNTLVNMRFNYEISNPVSLYSELWYIPAGVQNLKADYFETFIRIGALWEFGIK